MNNLAFTSPLPLLISHPTSLLQPSNGQYFVAIMTRGFATIKPECEETFDAVKETDALNFVIYEASANGKTISVAESGKYQTYEEVLSHFKDDAPRYAVVDFTYDSPTGDGPRHKLVFITWYVARFNLDA